MSYDQSVFEKFKALVKNPRKYCVKIIPYLNSIITPYKRSILELLKIERLSTPYPGHLKLLEIIKNKKDGFFVEVGGNDGYMQDPTYYLEKFLGWTGIIVEPLPIHKRCQANRKRSRVFSEAAVSKNTKDREIEFVDVNFMSMVKNTLDNEKDWVNKGESSQNIKHRVTRVPCRPTQEIINEGNRENKNIDLFVADVEGYEIEVLKGIDFSKNKPTFFLIEIHTPERKKAIDEFLENVGYKNVSLVGNEDYVYSIVKQ